MDDDVDMTQKKKKTYFCDVTKFTSLPGTTMVDWTARRLTAAIPSGDAWMKDLRSCSSRAILEGTRASDCFFPSTMTTMVRSDNSTLVLSG